MEKSIFEKISKAIEETIKECDSKKLEFEFVGSFIIIDPKKNFDVIDDRLFAWGFKEALEISLDGISEELKKEKKDFINW